MINEPPFSTARKLILSGQIKDLSELLETIKKTTLAKAMKTGPERFNKLIDNTELFLFKDAYTIAELIGVDEKAILDLIHNQYVTNKKARKTPSKKKS